jgi:outer membrane protein assembly factor BamD (BamD/ComL family)
MYNPGTNRENPAANRLGELLKRVRVPAKTDNEWQRLENDLFVRLDEKTAPRRRFGFSLSLPRFSVAWAAAAGLILFIAGAGITIALLKDGSPASFASIMSVRGSVSVTWSGLGAAQTVSSLKNSSFARKALPGTVISVPGNSSAIIRLGRGSALELFPGSRLVIKKSSESQQVCYLSSGSVLVKVTKRASGQRFEVQTPCAACRVVGTVFKVEAFDGSKTALSVYQGKVMLMPSAGVRGSDTLVETGRQLTVSRDIGPVGRRLSGMSAPIHDISVLGMLAEQGGAETGVLDVTSQPDGAMVLINGTMTGKTPFLAKARRGGDYSIAVFTEGYSPWETRVSIGRDLVCRVHAPLSPVVPQPQVVSVKKAASLPVAMRQQSETELALIPEYIEALVDISSGEYQRAICIFDSLWNSGIVDIKGRMCLMEKVNACYAKLGDFDKAAEALEDRYQKAETPQDKGQLLWEMATMRANCLGDYQGAEMALVEFLIVQPNAIWAHSAYSKLAEIQYYLAKYENAAETYKKHIATFPDDPDIDRSMYNLACILGQDLNRCEKAALWYSRLIDSFHASKYRAAAFFRRGECELNMGKIQDAQRDFKAYLSLSPDGIWRETCALDIKKFKGL